MYVWVPVSSIVLKPLWLAGAADIASSHNRGSILSTVKRLLGVKVCLRGLVRYDELYSENPSCSTCTCSAVNVLYCLLCDHIVLAMQAMWQQSVFCAGPFSWIQYSSYFLSWMILSLAPQYLCFSLSLSQTHTHTCTNNAYTHTQSPPYSSPYPRDI